ncbi:hypothetical protein TR51_12110 [Kitasatospora griseola]|uniref:DUF2004 domain-containing protein n=1 Tax=Kitasatospora griseola TaxID=2064 RepID=A0A0D0Q1L6_KITGR|nr:DUF2004 domain-containing protein [Kitasatospora griseola]KIQ64853.1 hypothetical protein TR51_12110 [Kitasatospora griseola]
MTTIEHARFGRLETGALHDPDVVWQGTAQLADGEVEVRLWAGPSSAPDAEELDALAARLTDLPALDTAARHALRAHLHEDRGFLDFHLDELDDSETVGRLVREAAGGEVGADAFVAAMRLSSVGLWLGGLSDEPPVVLDYTFEPDLGDQLLAVRATRDGAVASVDRES